MVIAALACTAAPREAYGQLGALVSPGRLSRAHASLEGITRCLTCHAAGQGVSADKCLTCHKPVADRIAQKRGIHRNVTTDCVSCHVEHAGVDAELRPFDQRGFDHRAQTGFPLDGLHAPLTATCDSCHKSRSFLSVTTSCASCHADSHKGTLGTRCETCHTTSIKFTESRLRFDHSRTAFPLTGSHARVTCTSCHVDTRTYNGVQFASCANCHTDPHQPRSVASCASCHNTQAWRTTRVDHSRTAFPLLGRHATVECAKCHVQPAMKVAPRAGTCATCHTDPHRGSFKQDCKACHDESGWQKGAFDHSTTRFPLVDRHAPLACVSCHKTAVGTTVVPARGGRPAPGRGAIATARGVAAARTTATDFRGLRIECVSCHTDVHENELGARCETCHTARSFEVPSFRHARQRAFFDGQHRALRCVDCHKPPATSLTATSTRTGSTPAARTTPAIPSPRIPHVGLARTSDTCVSCHQDAHAGQFGTRCETCHTLDAPKFAVTSFAHERTRFPLMGKHAPLACSVCHKVETRSFPAGVATTRRYSGLAIECASCHQDPHGGQLDQGCQTCHSAESFTIGRYTHLNASSLRAFFVGEHLSASCTACHKPAIVRTGLPAVTTYRTSTTCTNCHTDVHRGALGPRCETCHKP